MSINQQHAPEERENNAKYEADCQRLCDHFGKHHWPMVRRQLCAWGHQHLPTEAFDALSCQYDGVLLLYQMMQAARPQAMMQSGCGQGQLVSEANLRKMMRDPRYWREQDPAFRARVSAGYRQLYPE